MTARLTAIVVLAACATSLLGDATKKLIHAAGGQVIYAQKSDDSDGEYVFTADVVISVPPDAPGQSGIRPAGER